MTHTLTLPPRAHKTPFRLEATLVGLIRRHGRWRVIRAAFFARPRRQFDLDNLPPALKRDMGLPTDSPTKVHPWHDLL